MLINANVKLIRALHTVACLLHVLHCAVTVQLEAGGRWQHTATAPTNTVAPMPVTSADPLRTSLAATAPSQPNVTHAAPSQPNLTHAAAANPLTSLLAGSPFLNQYPAGFTGVNPFLTQPGLSNEGLAGANVAGLGATNLGQAPASNSCDPNVELATILSRLMLSSASQPVAVAQQNLLANMTAQLAAASQPHGLHTLLAAGGQASPYGGMLQPGLLNATLQQSLMTGTSLFSPAVQYQLLLHAGLLPAASSQTAVHSGTSVAAGHFTTSVSASALGNSAQLGDGAVAGGYQGTAASTAHTHADDAAHHFTHSLPQ